MPLEIPFLFLVWTTKQKSLARVYSELSFHREKGPVNRWGKSWTSGPQSHAKTPRRVFDDMMMVLRDRRTFVIVPSSRADDRFQFFSMSLLIF